MARKLAPSTRKNRKPYAWERKVVTSSIPPGERVRRCLACSNEQPAKLLRHGYCPTCWTTTA